MIQFAVSIPSKGHMYTKIAITWNHYNGGVVLFINNHELFDSLLDESKLYIVVGTNDWNEEEKIEISTGIRTVGELRKLRKDLNLKY